MGLIPLGFWAASGAGGGAASAAYELISTTVLGSSAASVTFSGLGTSAAAYKHLQIRAVSQLTATDRWVILQYNGDTNANSYSTHTMRKEASGSIGTYAGANSGGWLWYQYASGYSSSIFGATIIDILDFNSTTKNKTTRALTGETFGATADVTVGSNAWYSTAAITSMTLSATSSANWVAGSRFSLYGLRG